MLSPPNGINFVSDIPARSVEEIVPLLEKLELFAGLSDDVLREIAAIAQGGPVEAGTAVLEEGDPRRSDSPAADLVAVSRLLQRGMVPWSAPKVDGFDVAAGTTLEEEGRGNTIWDHVRMKDGEVAMLVLDVREDGFPASCVAGMARSALRTAAACTEDAAEMLRLANTTLADMHVDGVDQFVECGVLIPRNGGAIWASAGRVPAGILRRDGTFVQLGSHGPPLGMMDGFSYGAETLEVGAGDTALVLSGGSTGLFRGAADLVAQVMGKPAGEVVSTVHRAIRRAQEAFGTTEEISVVYLRCH